MKKAHLGIIFLFFPYLLNAEINTSALWRSALLSGWGQYNAGYKTKGLIFMISEKLLVVGFIYTYYIQDEAYYEYTKSTSDFNNKWDNYKSKLSQCQIVIGVTGAFYLYNLIDAAFFTTSNKKNIYMTLNKNNGYIYYSYKF